MPVLYFDYDTLLTIHDKVIAVSGGFDGVKDQGLLKSPLEHIQNDDYYPTLAEKVAHLIYAINKNHGFHDGNKRTALASGALLLELNGYGAVVPSYFVMLEEVMVAVAENRLNKDQLIIIIQDFTVYGQLQESTKIIIINAIN